MPTVATVKDVTSAFWQAFYEYTGAMPMSKIEHNARLKKIKQMKQSCGTQEVLRYMKEMAIDLEDTKDDENLTWFIFQGPIHLGIITKCLILSKDSDCRGAENFGELERRNRKNFRRNYDW